MLVDYVSKWIEVVSTGPNDAKTVVKHIKSLILYNYRVPKAIISDRGTHFYNKTLGALLAKYHVIIRCLLVIIPKQMAKLKSLIKKSRAY